MALLHAWRSAGEAQTLMKLRSCLSGTLLALLVVWPAQPADSGSYLMYVGTYTNGPSKGIYGYRFSPTTGTITPLGAEGETANPSFLVIHPNRRFLYAVNENPGNNEPGNSVTAFTLDTKTGKLGLLNRVTTKGSGPCHLVVDKTGKILIVANYGSGSVASFPIEPDGRLGEASGFVQHQGSSVNPARQKGPHAHCIAISPDNRFVLVADLGLDQVLVYRLDAKTGALTPNDPPFASVTPGFGPRHLAFHPNGKFVYLINEMGEKVTTFSYDSARGSLKELQTVSALPANFTGQSTAAELVVDHSGKFVYGSNRGDDSIAVFAVDKAAGTLSLVQHAPTQGKTPRNFAVDPTGAYLFAANQNTGNIVIFRVDASTGKLTPTGQTITDAPAPVCIVFVRAN